MAMSFEEARRVREALPERLVDEVLTHVVTISELHGNSWANAANYLRPMIAAVITEVALSRGEAGEHG